ncbi:MAG: hypothetical protein ABEJ04_01180 [Halobacteriaceae archaeon]
MSEGKVSIGLRGWRFDESEVFDESGDFRSLDEMPEDVRVRLTRLVTVFDAPCDACWLVHGDEGIAKCNVSEVVYGEPYAEVTLCAEHERDFYYWYQEAGGARHAGTEAFQEEFHEWFAGGGRAPDWFEGPEHVQTDPERTPDPDVPDLETLNVELPEEERERLDVRELAGDDLDDRDEDEGGGEGDPADLDLEDVDLDAEYPG